MATFGERFVEHVHEYLLQYKLLNARGQPSLGKINGKILAELLDKFEAAEKRKDKVARERRLSKTERNKLFDALAIGCGADPKNMTTVEGTQFGVGISAIIQATPDITPEEVAEACARYKTMRPGCTITPTAVSKIWSSVMPRRRKDGTERPPPESIPEPDDWRALMRDDPEEQANVESSRQWPEMLPHYQRRIAKKCARITAARS